MAKLGPKARTVVLLASIWFVVTLPLPWLINNPAVPFEQLLGILGIIGIVSIPFVALGIVWTLRPELAARD